MVTLINKDPAINNNVVDPIRELYGFCIICSIYYFFRIEYYKVCSIPFFKETPVTYSKDLCWFACHLVDSSLHVEYFFIPYIFAKDPGICPINPRMRLPPKYPVCAYILLRSLKDRSYMFLESVKVDKTCCIFLFKKEVICSLKGILAPHLTKLDKTFTYHILVFITFDKCYEDTIQTCKINKIIPTMYSINNVMGHLFSCISIIESFKYLFSSAIMNPWRQYHTQSCTAGNIWILINGNPYTLFRAKIKLFKNTVKIFPVFLSCNFKMGEMDPASALFTYGYDLIH